MGPAADADFGDQMKDSSVIKIVLIVAITICFGLIVNGHFSLEHTKVTEDKVTERALKVEEKKTERTQERAKAWRFPWTEEFSRETK